ncbi:MAG: GGDEF domain-containing protein, partial [Ilumatobacteraceae bacterium]
MSTPIRRMVITGRILTEAGVYMCAFGLAVGLVFPYFAVLLGVEDTTAFQPTFVLSSVAAGMVVGIVGTFIVRRTVGRPLRHVAASMSQVRDGLADASSGGVARSLDLDAARLDLTSSDELGECARSFNTLLDELSRTWILDDQIRDVTAAMSEHLEPARLAQVALDRLVVGGPYDAGAVLVLRRDEIELVSSTGLRDPSTLASHHLVREVIERGHSRQLSCADDVVIDGAVIDIRPRQIELRALASHGVPFGVMVLAATTELGNGSRRLVDATTVSLAMSLRNALTHQEVEQLAAIDALTGLYNRRLGMQRLEEEFARAERSRAPLSVVMFDVDHFKQVNDTYGHLAGDRVLRMLADSVTAIVRDGDTVVRLGGEEFLAILPGASLGDAHELAERMRHACAGCTIQHGQVPIRITVSLGIAATPAPGIATTGHLVARADEAMYAAKRSGRNQVVIADA